MFDLDGLISWVVFGIWEMFKTRLFTHHFYQFSSTSSCECTPNAIPGDVKLGMLPPFWDGKLPVTIYNCPMDVVQECAYVYIYSCFDLFVFELLSYLYTHRYTHIYIYIYIYTYTYTYTYSYTYTYAHRTQNVYFSCSYHVSVPYIAVCFSVGFEVASSGGVGPEDGPAAGTLAEMEGLGPVLRGACHSALGWKGDETIGTQL